MNNPTAAMLVIGDEILSGRTQDTNTFHVAQVMTEIGIDLKEARVVSDEKAKIISAVQALSQSYDYVFTSGGIGPTHDDITADCVAEAFGQTIDIRADAREILAAYYLNVDKPLTDARLRMARIPEGATLIENEISGAPGFILHNVHVMAGVPRIFKSMLEKVTKTLQHGEAVLSRSLPCPVGEGDVAQPLAEIALDFPDVSIGSYPYSKEQGFGLNLVYRSQNVNMLDAVENRIQSMISSLTKT